jgi:hypothetical protein
VDGPEKYGNLKLSITQSNYSLPHDNLKFPKYEEKNLKTNIAT